MEAPAGRSRRRGDGRGRIPARQAVCRWITPPVVAELDLDPETYRQGAPDPDAPGGRTFQPITGFRVGLIGGRDEVATSYGRPVSFGIRRCEFDHYLLQRSGARLRLGDAVTSLRSNRGQWIVNGAIRTPMLVGAGGHFCPVSRSINGPTNTAPVVVAQEAEFPIDSRDRAAFAIDGEAPELYFCRDLKGYGWCFRKQRHLNIGLGRLDRQSLPAATAEFLAFLWRGRRSHRSPHRGGGGMRMPCTAPRIVASSTRVCCWPATPRVLPILKAVRGSARRSSRDCWRRSRSSRRADGTPGTGCSRTRIACRHDLGPVPSRVR